MAREPEVTTELRRSLGAQLATFRLAAELTQGRLAQAVVCDRTKIVHVEKGRARADERFWRAVDAACDAGGALVSAFLALEGAKVEFEQRERERRLVGVRAKAAALRRASESVDSGSSTQVDVPLLQGLRRAILGHQPVAAAAGTSAQLVAGVAQAHRLYQGADYDGVARLLPTVITRMQSSPSATAQTKAAAYLAAAKLATKVGDLSLAWVAADRSLRLASETDRHGLIGIANDQVACALLGRGLLADAEQTAAQAAEYVATHTGSFRDGEDAISVRGALLLLLALIAGRQDDAHAAKNYLRDAALLANTLGRATNRLWTAFGHTNIAIHALAVHVRLGDSRTAQRLGDSIDTDVLPTALRGRRSQVHLELGWASVQQGDRGLAVLHLLEAERVAGQAVSRNATARALLETLLARERKSATPGLRALAVRAGVLQ